MSDVNGVVEDGWEQVADTFRSNFKEGKDLGAACCVYVDGRAVVDLWGGLADRERNRPWEQDTVVAVASTTKGATAMCAHLLVERGELDLDAPVIRYWPEFGAADKEEIPVRWLLSHQAGLPVVDAPLTFEEACAWDPLIRALEVQKPLWTPGTEHLYHAQTYGFLVGEVVKRITGRSLGTFFAEEIAGPLGLSAWIGLPEEIEPRVARLDAAPFPYNSVEDMATDFGALMGLDPAVAVALVKTLWGPNSVLIKAGSVGGITEENMGSRAFRAAEFPGGNMFANARSIARMYAATVSDVDGICLLQPDTVAAMTVVQTDRTRMHGVPPELEPATRNMFNMSLGFWRSSPPVMPMLGPASFGHPGSGGSLGAADPEARVGFGYVSNLWAATLIDPRAIELASAVRKCLD
ncbi:CubicO group peptidase, beta-lactamase class C family [Singulisphaera sp. GP187]|uniref:serine hydrolase domain-containing protein n=1 Tax=Singulisphaera sp. GP187 TaxID=1882752 RepID=UPI00092AD0EA|nr:serine hydrolase domain-containing protein [Singulisphaera sp. GP187]SIO66241.1 CubicO group peptidase, beta-lactamase class C family [Singulisphaera sp. GP187]